MNKYTENKNENKNENKKENKIFDMKPIVYCDDCQHYFQNTCDGVKLTTTKKCRDFIATRGYDLQSKIDSTLTHTESELYKQDKFNFKQVIFDIALVTYLVIYHFGMVQ